MEPPESVDPEVKKVLDGLEDFVAKRHPKRRIKVLPSGPLRYVRIDFVLDERAGKDEIDEMLEEVTKMGEAKRVGEPDIANVLTRQKRFHGALFAFVLVGVPLAVMATLVMLAWDGIYVHPLYEILQALPSWMWSRGADVTKVLVGFGGFFGLVALVEVMRRRFARAKKVVE